MTDLLERLEVAEAGSRELDLRVFEHFDRVDGQRWTEADLDYALTDPDLTINPPHFTTSLDAALALAERVLPGWWWSISSERIGEPEPRPFASGWLSDGETGELHTARAKTPALALCIAILKATHKAEGAEG